MKKSLIVALTMACCRVVNAGVGDWKNYTDMKNTVGVVSARDAVWGATSGGVLRFTVQDSAFVKFTNSEGLTGNDISAIGLDTQGSVWIGERSGTVDIYSPLSGTWRYVRDIAVSIQSQKKINAFYNDGDAMYIATGFGLSVFSTSRFEFSDTYGNFGSLAHPNVTSLVRFNGRIYVGTSAGPAISKANAVNLAAPESWDSFTNPGSVTAMAVFQGAVYAGTSTGVYVYQNNTWDAVTGLSQAVVSLVGTDSLLYIAATGGLLSLTPANTVSVVGGATPAPVTSIAIDSSKRLLAGFQDGGIGIFNTVKNSWTQIVPNGPASNFFVSVAVDEGGILWTASARANGKGFYSFDGSLWKNFNTGNFPQLKVNEYFNVSIGPNNSKWIGSWGGGLALVNSSGNLVRVFDNSYPGFVGTGPQTYTVVGRTSTDNDGNVWVPLFGALNGNVLWKMRPDSVWEVVKSPSNAYNLFLGITVDRNGTKWCLNSFPEFKPGDHQFFYYNRAGTIPGLDNDFWGSIGDADGIVSTVVTCLVEDKEGSLWVGTDLGISIISETQDPKRHISNVFQAVVRDQFINYIAVDPLNNKWVAMRQGVAVLSPDGTSVLAQYNVATTNGKLVDNNVLSIAFDEKRGVAYFGTESGLSSLEIPVIATVEKMSGLEVGPNPYIVPSNDKVVIKVLAENSTIKILSVTGKLVKQFGAQGAGRAFWDGTDENGVLVGSGVYVVVAFAENGTQVATAKVAVVRR